MKTNGVQPWGLLMLVGPCEGHPYCMSTVLPNHQLRLAEAHGEMPSAEGAPGWALEGPVAPEWLWAPSGEH